VAPDIQTAYKTRAFMARPGFTAPAAALLAVFLVGYSACSTTGASSGSGGANAGGGSAAGTPQVVNRWWVTCPLFGCPNVPAADRPLPCSAAQQEGLPCDFVGTTCDNRYDCGQVMLCAPNDPKGNGCP
jgi:hypothetical protein